MGNQLFFSVFSWHEPDVMDVVQMLRSPSYLVTIISCFFLLTVVVVTRPLPMDGSMAADHGAPEAGQLHRAWTRDRKERDRESPKSELRKESVAGQYRMR